MGIINTLTAPIRMVNSTVRAGFEAISTPFTMAWEGAKGALEGAMGWVRNGAIVGAIGGLVSTAMEKKENPDSKANWLSRAAGGAFVGGASAAVLGATVKGTQSAGQEAIDSGINVATNLREGFSAADELTPSQTPSGAPVADQPRR